MLNFDNIVKINLHVNITARDVSSFEHGLIIGKSNVITTDDRMKLYKNLAAMLTDFTTDSDEYKAAALYFAQKPVPSGVYIARRGASESLVDAFDACLNMTADFWAVYTCGATDDDVADLDAHLNELNRCMQFYGVVGTSEALAVATAMTTSKSRRTMVIQAAAANDAAAVMGRLCGLVRTKNNSSFTLCYKEIKDIKPVVITEDDITALHEKNGCVYVTRGYNRQLLDGASTGSGLRVDEIMYLDMIAGDIQDALVALLQNEDNRLPQNDSTTTRFENAISTVLENYYSRNVLGSGEWHGEAIGNVEFGDVLLHGYAMYAEPYYEQDPVDREAKKAMPITVMIILAGAVEFVEINVYAQH